MPGESIGIEQRGDVAILTLKRPPANAVCLEFARDLEAALESDALASARALVVTGSGAFFSGGLDLKVVPRYSATEQRELLAIINRAAGRLYAFPAPVIAAANGHAIAAGFILTLACDYRVGPTGAAVFGLTEARVGIPFPAVPMIILDAELAPEHVRYTTLYARTFGSEEALRRGVFDEIVPPASVLARACEVAADMATIPADAYRRIKQQVRRAAIDRIEETVAASSDPMLASWVSPGAAKASADWLEAANRKNEAAKPRR